jgi:hypothetical protein
MKATSAMFGLRKSDKAPAAARTVIKDDDDEDSPFPEKEKETTTTSKQYVRGIGEHNIVPFSRYDCA